MSKEFHLSNPLRWMMVVAAATLLLAGCGNKKWPEPQAAQDRFAWTNATAELDDGCLRIQAQLTGSHHNLDEVLVELQPVEPWSVCPSCPFQASIVRFLDPASPQYSRLGRRVSLILCGLDPDKAYRWRLVGTNVHETLDRSVTDVFLAAGNHTITIQNP